jgi:hypothetical protein
MQEKNVRLAVRRLIGKKALELAGEYDSRQGVGFTYRVFSEDEILRRRKQAGLEWAVRNRGGVALLESTTPGGLEGPGA